MKSNLITFAPRRKPHNDDGSDDWGEGAAICMNCRHEWEAVSQIGSLPFDCPSCRAAKGVWKNFFMRKFGMEEVHHWQCRCGCEFFHVSPHGIYCPNCGRSQRPYDEPKDRA